MSETFSLDDVCTPASFAGEYPHIFEGKGAPSLKYLLRTRYVNGLSECGAVIEPAKRRPMIVRPKFLEWLLDRTKVA